MNLINKGIRPKAIMKLSMSLAVICFFYNDLLAQTNILNSTGQSASIQDINFSWSIGEMALTQTFKQQEFILTQGFLQNTMQTVVANHDLTKSTRIKIYPNPFTEQFNIEWDSPFSWSWKVEVRDIVGHRVLWYKTTSVQKFFTQSIWMPASGPGVYQLTISSTDNRNPVQFSQWILKL